MSPTQSLSLKANGLTFAALAAGPETGPLVLLLHGFPELSRSWNHQLPALAQAGYRAVAPDLRGYGGTDKTGPYDIRTLAADIRELVKALGREQAIVVGHDWGGATACATATFEPQVVERLVVLNCPHPYALSKAILRNPRQALRSWYMFFFQIPGLPEWVITRNGAGAVARALKGGSFIRTAWTKEELTHYREAFQLPGAASAALGYYRAAFRGVFGSRGKRGQKISAPTLFLWGREDRFLGEELAGPRWTQPYWEPGNVPTVRYIDGAGHFVQNEAPEAINRELLSWLGPPKAA